MVIPPLNAEITRRIDVAPGVWIIHVAPAGWELRDFEAGQYTALGLPGTHPRCDGKKDDPPLDHPEKLIRRDYSIASSPKERRYLEFYMVYVEEGGLSPRLYCLHAGERVWLSKRIAGTFVLSRAPKDVNLVFIATGTGIAPFMSMLRTTLPADKERRIGLFHGVRRSADLGYRKELLGIQRFHPRFTYIPTVSRFREETAPWHGRTGYVQDLWRSRVLDQRWRVRLTPENTHVYICGSPAMIDDTIAMLRAEGFRPHTEKTPGQIHIERYW